MHLAEEQPLLVQFSPLALERFSETSTTPATETERIIHSLVADVIGIEESAFGVEDDIFRLGANSITAMGLASIARTKGLCITVPQILQNPTVQQMASLIQNSSQGKTSLHGQPAGSLSLSTKPGCTQALRQLVSRKCHIDESLVEAAYPCTSLQASLFLRSLQDAGSYMIRYEWAIPRHLDLHKFREAWDLVFHKYDILRTRFVEDDDATIWQAVIREKLQWRIMTNESHIKENFGTDFGKPLLRLGLFQGHGTEQTSRFIFEAHHSIMDAWSCDLVLDAFSKAYNIQSASNQLPNSPQFGSFIDYIQSIDEKESECFWKEQYSDFRGHGFPLPSSALAGPRVSLKARLFYKSSETSQFTVPEYLRGAWAIVISSFSEEADIVLGIVESGRDVSLSGIENLVGPTIATLPVRTQVLPTEQIIDFMQKLRHQRAQMVHHQHFGLQNIASVSVEAGRGCEFQNLLVIQAPVQRRKNAVLRVEDAAIGVAMTEYPIVLECFPEEGAVSFVLDYDASVMTTTDAQKLLAGIRTTFQQLREGSTERILGDLTPTISTNKATLELWNSNLPRNIKEKIHHLISDQARNEPLAPAIMSWDGEMNFRQLDQISTRLGEYLNCLGYGSKSIIPVCFEKSMWYIIAVLGTLKAGAAFLPLDPSQPIGRLHEIVGQVQADVCLVSKKTDSLFPAPQFKTIPVSQDGWPRNANDDIYLSKTDRTGDPDVPRDPSNLAYIIFTSGSTGKPKGVMIEHDSFCSGACVRAELIHRNKNSRVFSFSSYSFDTSIEDVLTTLIVGGCVCIPSEYESKNELAEAIQRYRANTLDTTPSVVAAISPEDTPGLTTVILGGEAMTADNVAKWAPRVTLINTYGPSECSIVSTVTPPATVDTDPSNIGRGVGCITWIVDENDHERLMPIGEVGELLIEGPIVGRGYHGDVSHEAFLCNTKWRSTFNLKPSWRFYKTGDLARYATDGSIVFVGRKDSQCKIRGQRVEVAEIEYRLRDAVAHEQVAVECIPVPGLGPTIVGFLGDKTKDESSDAVLHTAGSLPLALSSIQSRLLTHLPTYMVPSFYVEVGHFPMQISGKLGRGALRSIFMKLYKTQCSTRNAVAAAESTKQPQHFIGIALQTLWARQLGIRATSIGLHDTFFALGGNSLKAMQLVAQCRKAGLSLTVEDIFKGPSLEKMTASILSRTSATPMPVSDGQNNAEVSRLRDTLPTVDNETIEEVCAACGITANLIQYVYPCSPLQESFMRGSLHQPGSYIATHIFKIADDVDPHKLVEAWSTVAEDSCILRTRLVQTESAGLVQAVLHEKLAWKKAATLDECRRNSEPMTIQSGSPLSQLYLVEGEESYLAWTAHHAIYDAWMLDQLTEALRAAYNGTWVRPKAEYRDYIRYIKTLDSDMTRQFWKTQLASPSSAGRFVKQDQQRHTLRMERSLEQTVQVKFPNTSNLAFSTYIRAAWALTVSEYGESEDVIFGIVLAGRAIQLADVDTIMAPTIATAPLRIRLDRKSTVGNFLQLVQNQSASVMPHEQFGVQNIKELNQDCWEACDFESLLDIHPMVDHVQPNTIIELESSRNNSQSFHTHPLVLTCRPNQKSLDLECVFDESMVDQTQALRMIHHFAHMLRQLVHVDGVQSLTQLGTEGTVADLERISPFDKALLHQWNSAEYCAVQNFIHEKVRAQVVLDAKRSAIEAWDRNFTYGELDIVSSRLAVHLQDIGVGEKPIIPLCFNKSAWAVVAMLAVLKIGGAYAALDPSHPSERLRMMVKHTKATLVLAGKEHAAMFDGQVEHVVVLHDLLLAELPQPPIKLKLKATLDPQDAALIVFTSGSTGVPKGVVLQHDAFCTLADGMAAEMNFSADSRVLQFAAYAFDVSSSEIFLTLMHGGCCCIPSDADRLSNLAGVIADFGINWLYLTPTVANLVLPEDVENVKTLVLGGEAARQELIDKFANRTCLINSYGPAEGTIWPSMAKFSASSSPSDIGSGTRCHMWLVDPNNHNQLVPIGVPGEILLEGPMVARGYLFDEAKTKAVFIDPPNWATPRQDGLQRRFYKVGDMARQKADGTLSFLGRKDTQVKLRGQRIELGEIEFRIAKNSQTIKAAAVEVANLNRHSQVLVAFVSFSSNVDICYENNIGAVTTPIRNDLLALQESLSKHLPPYMIPSFYVPLEQSPKTLSQKLDRHALRTLFENIPRSNLKEYSLSLHSTRKASSPLERQVQSLWARILNIKPQDIGMHDSPVRLGANSLTAIQASTLARKEGLNMPVSTILHAKSLAEICDATSPIRHLEEQPLETFGLLKKRDESDFKILMAEIEDQCNVDQAQIEDAYPCTPLQEGMILHSENRPGSYVAQRIFPLDPTIDVARFKSAWCNVAKVCDILRTRIVSSEAWGLVQTVLDEAIVWAETQDLQTYLHKDRNLAFDFGAPLMRFCIAEGCDNAVHQFIWTTHHASYDGWTINLLLRLVDQQYHEDSIASPPRFAVFIQNILSAKQSESTTFWAQLLNGFVSPGSKLVKPPVDKSPLSKTVKHSIQSFGIGRCPVTGPSLIRAAWGLLLGCYYDSRDVTFGIVTNGRSTAVPGIMDLCGPTMSIIPTRVKIDDEMNLHSFLDGIQNQGLEAIPFAQYGMQYIQRIDPSTRAACQFETLLDIDIQNDKSIPNLFGAEERSGTVEAFHTYAIVLGARITSDRLEFEMEFDSRRISESYIRGILGNLERIIQQLKNSSAMSSVGVLRATLEGEKRISDANLTKSVASLPPQQEVALSSLGENTTERQGPLETKLHALISKVLQVDPAEIGIHDHFIAMGGDSISAMHLASLARRNDIPLTASDVFRHPTIYGMAQHCSISMTDSIVETAHSQTPTARSRDDAVRRHVSTSLQIPMSDVQDIVSATDFQAWAVAGDLMKSRGWSNYVIITFSSPLNKERLLTAFKTVIERNAILRTAFVAFGSQILQVVRRKPYLKHEHLRRNINFQQEIHAWVDSMIANGQDSAMSEGSVRMITTGPTSESVCALAMTLSHAQSDATSLSHIGSDLSDAFDGRVLSTRPSFSIFAARATSIEQQKEAECFWRTELHRARMTKVTQLSPPSHSYQYPVAKTYTRTIPTPERRKHTFATALKAAWALTLAKHTKQNDIVFGHLVSGRTLPISGVGDMVGPCLNIVPVRIRIHPGVTTESLLDSIQDRYLASMPHETLGFNRIVEACTTWPRSTRYSSILQHQNIADVPSLEFNNGKTQAVVNLRCPSHDSTDIWVISIPKGNTMEVTLSCNDNLVSPYEAQTLLGNLVQAIAMFMSDDACTVMAQDEVEWERDGTRRLPREGDKLQKVDDGGVSLDGQRHSLLHKVREIWQNVLFTSPEEVEYISPTTPYYKVRGGHAATVLLLAQYKAQIAPHITMEEVIDHPTLEDHVQLLLAKQNTERVGSRNR